MPGTSMECARRFIVRIAAPLAFIILGVCAAPVLAVLPVYSEGGSWSVIARCESGGNWNIGTGVSYPGGLRFSPVASPAGEAPLAKAAGTAARSPASPVHAQVLVAERVLRSQGMGAWPRCSPAAPTGDLRADQARLADSPTR